SRGYLRGKPIAVAGWLRRVIPNCVPCPPVSNKPQTLAHQKPEPILTLSLARSGWGAGAAGRGGAASAVGSLPRHGGGLATLGAGLPEGVQISLCCCLSSSMKSSVMLISTVGLWALLQNILTAWRVASLKLPSGMPPKQRSRLSSVWAWRIWSGRF